MKKQITMTKTLHDFFKDTIAYLAGLCGFAINYDNIYKYLFGILSLIFLVYQLLHKRSERKLIAITLENAELEKEKLELELEKLKSEKKDEKV
jgi:hypothetical protein